jgi:arylsulfatase A-like enzyme
VSFQTTKERLLDAAGGLGFWVAVCAAGWLWIAAVDWAGVLNAGLGRGGEMAQVLTGLSLTAGVWLGAAVFVLAKIIEAHREEDGRWTFAGLLVAVLPASPFVWYVVDGALSGPTARQMFPPPWGVPLVALGLCVGLGCAFALLFWLGRLRREGKMDLPGALMGTAALLGMSAMFQWVNGHAYLRLYPVIHTGLTWCAFALAAAGFVFVLLPAGRRRWPGYRWAGPAVAVAAVLSWFLLLSPLRQSNRVRFLLTDRCPSGLQVLSLWPGVRGDRGMADIPVSTGRANIGSADHPWGMLRMRGRSVLLITVDALLADRMGCYGGRRGLTPNLDRWAKSAVRFDRAYCHAPHSSFSLSATLTGRPMRSYAALKKPLPVTLATRLRQAGYVAWGFCTRGVFYTGETALMGYVRDNFGFERFDPHGYDAKKLTDLAVRALEVYETAKSSFFLWVHYFDLHEPYRRHPGLDFGRKPKDRYDSEIAYSDRHVRRLLDSAAELDPPPIVILTSDHGEEFGEHGGHYHGSSLYEEQVRVPLIIAVPGVKSRVIAQPVSLLSVVPTVLDLLEMDSPEPPMEISLVPAMLGSAREIPPVHAEVHTKRMVAAGRYKLIWDTWRRTVELYDLKKDPKERRDLSDSRPDRTAALRGLIRDHIRKLGQRAARVPAALAAARLGGLKAAAGLCALLGNPKAKQAHRMEAARRLGRMPGTCAAAAFKRALADEDEAIAAEGAIGLGELRRQEGAAALRALLSRAVEPTLVHRAAVAAGRLGIPESQRRPRFGAPADPCVQTPGKFPPGGGLAGPGGRPVRG